MRGIELAGSGKLRRRTNGGSVGLRRMMLLQEIEEPISPGVSPPGRAI